MPKNKISDLNDHLFAQLEKLGEEELKGDALNVEIERSKAMSGLAGNIIGAAKVTVDAMKLIGRGDIRKEDMPLLLTNSSEKDKK